ncbi:hypothetical protein M3231_19500 [Neobacillus mesonae]|nr:hypothetical protein [Neobacillus mesonae]
MVLSPDQIRTLRFSLYPFALFACQPTFEKAPPFSSTEGGNGIEKGPMLLWQLSDLFDEVCQAGFAASIANGTFDRPWSGDF